MFSWDLGVVQTSLCGLVKLEQRRMNAVQNVVKCDLWPESILEKASKGVNWGRSSEQDQKYGIEICLV